MQVVPIQPVKRIAASETKNLQVRSIAACLCRGRKVRATQSAARVNGSTFVRV